MDLLASVDFAVAAARSFFNLASVASVVCFSSGWDGSGIAVYAVQNELVVQVRAGGEAGGADGADGLALFYFLAFFDRALGEVQVLGDNAVGVFDEYVVAIGAGIGGLDHGAVAG